MFLTIVRQDDALSIFMLIERPSGCCPISCTVILALSVCQICTYACVCVIMFGVTGLFVVVGANYSGT